jgi:hypothetical protein
VSDPYAGFQQQAQAGQACLCTQVRVFKKQEQVGVKQAEFLERGQTQQHACPADEFVINRVFCRQPAVFQVIDAIRCVESRACNCRIGVVPQDGGQCEQRFPVREAVRIQNQRKRRCYVPKIFVMRTAKADIFRAGCNGHMREFLADQCYCAVRAGIVIQSCRSVGRQRRQTLTNNVTAVVGNDADRQVRDGCL